MTWEQATHLDQTVERNKNLHDATMVDNWIRKSHHFLEKFKLEPLPGSYLGETVPSETGTDYSAALTSDVDPTKSPVMETPPDSPPWRSKNEGGIEAEMPPLPLQEIRTHLALMQEQQRQEEDAQRAGQEEAERKGHLAKEKQRRDADEKLRQDQELLQRRRQQQQIKIEREEQERQQRIERQKSAQLSNPANVYASDKRHDDRDPAGRTTRQLKGNPPGGGTAAPPKQITLGITFSQCDQGGKQVARVKDAGCAALHGELKVGDRVLTIDGEDLTDKTAMQLNKLMVGDEGSSAVLEVVKAGQTEAQSIVIERLLTSSASSFGVENFGRPGGETFRPGVDGSRYGEKVRHPDRLPDSLELYTGERANAAQMVAAPQNPRSSHVSRFAM